LAKVHFVDLFYYGRPMEYCRLLYFRPVVSSFFIVSFSLAYSQPSHIGCLPDFHTWCAILECRSETCCTCTRLGEMQDAKNSPSGHHCTTLSGCVFATKACIDDRKHLLNSNVSSTCPHIYRVRHKKQPPKKNSISRKSYNLNSWTLHHTILRNITVFSENFFHIIHMKQKLQLSELKKDNFATGRSLFPWQSENSYKAFVSLSLPSRFTNLLTTLGECWILCHLVRH